MVRGTSSIDAKIYRPPKKPMVEVVCAWCKKTFKARASRVARAYNLFCSVDHRIIGRNIDGGSYRQQKKRRVFNSL